MTGSVILLIAAAAFWIAFGYWLSRKMRVQAECEEHGHQWEKHSIDGLFCRRCRQWAEWRIK